MGQTWTRFPPILGIITHYYACLVRCWVINQLDLVCCGSKWWLHYMHILSDGCCGSCPLIPECCPHSHSLLLPCKRMAVWNTEYTSYNVLHMWHILRCEACEVVQTTSAWRVPVPNLVLLMYDLSLSTTQLQFVFHFWHICQPTAVLAFLMHNLYIQFSFSLNFFVLLIREIACGYARILNLCVVCWLRF